MKNIIYIIVIIVTTNIYSQQIPGTTSPDPIPSIIIPMENYEYDDYQENCYIQDTLNKQEFWEGTWEYTNGNTTFKIVLEVIEMYYNHWSPDNRKYYTDDLFGGYYYKENGVIMTDQLEYDTEILYPTENPLSIGIGGDDNTYIHIMFNDPVDNNNSGKAFLKLLPNSTTQATWTIDISTGYSSTCTLPNNIILTKL